ncbi:hypothetical protein KC901_01335 [Patescibacteria group bacterium]|nr:hypothetical protein [Patescibacteria group bacterium]
MTYNLHPIFVHFPIAFLLLYSVVKILPFRRWFPGTSWNHIYKILLIPGVIGAYLSMATGETAAHLTRPDRDLVGLHEFFAGATTNIYLILLIGEFFPVILRVLRNIKHIPRVVVRIVYQLGRIINHPTVMIGLALVGAIALFLTGVFGGILTHGTSADPLAPFILNIFGL